MKYISASMPNSISIDGIYSVLKVDFSKPGVGIGESHDFPEISFVSRGENKGICDGKENTAKKGQFFIIPPGVFHKSAGVSDSELFIVSFASSSPKLEEIYNVKINLSEAQERDFREIVNIGLGLFVRRAPGSNVGGMIIRDAVDKYELEVFKKRLELFLLDLHRCYAKPKSAEYARREALIEKVRLFLVENISENFSCQEIADKNKVSLTKLKQVFKEKGGVMGFFNTLKINRAKELIAEGKMNFTEISDHLGFSSLHYFSKTFKKFMGVTPSAYERGKGVFY